MTSAVETFLVHEHAFGTHLLVSAVRCRPIKPPDRVELSMEITVNGEKRQLSESFTVVGLLQVLGIKPQSVAVERNLKIVPRGDMETERIEEGDVLEIIRLVGGG